MDIYTVDPLKPDPKAVRDAAEAVLRGGVIAFPTDTVYGLSCSLLDPAAVEFVYRLKKRPSHLSVIALLSEADAVHPLVDALPEVGETLMKRFWPGPLSIIFRASSLVPMRVRGERGTIALRVPKHPLCEALLEAVGGPLVSSSANLSGQPPCADAQEIQRVFGNQLDVLLDGGPSGDSLPSTVVDVSSGRLQLVREGAVDVSAFVKSGTR